MREGFTPGRWAVSDTGPSDLYVISTGPRAAVCHVLTDDRARRGEAEADARLIAAAPELYELAELTLRLGHREECPSDLQGVCTCEYEKAEYLRRRVIGPEVP